MLLKYSQLQKRSKLAGSGKPQRSSGNAKAVNGKGKGHRKAIKTVASKRIKAAAPRREEAHPIQSDPCDNSNDSGLGFDHHLDFQVPRSTQPSLLEREYFWSDNNKRQRVDIKLESDNATDNFTFSHPQRAPPTSGPTPCHRVGKAVPSGKGLKRGSQSGLGTNVGLSRDGKVQLVIVSQPEMQHRARYQTEGSRGAVKDRTGNGFPIVKLIGYDKPAILEVYIGTDQGRETPHMFYQACRVSGKNSTPCVEKNVNGTVLIEIEFDPAKDMTVLCDCVGILKERNVDVEHRFPEESTTRNKKKSTRCRMVFRTVITNGENQLETLQVTSQPIICTQPPGVPEICKKSLVSCQASGGLELFVLGKNFLKDTRVIFSEGEINAENYWEAVVQPDKEFLQQSHLVCTIPPYRDEDIKEPVIVKLSVVSSGRSSEHHTFVYAPLGTPPLQALPREPMVAARAALAHCVTSQPAVPFTARNLLLGIPLIQLGSHPSVPAASFVQPEAPKCKEEALHSAILMPPPPQTELSAVRHPSQNMSAILDGHIELKREVESPPSDNVTPDLSISQATIRQFVSSTPLPSLSVENFLSNIESTTTTSASQVPITSQKPYGKSNMSAGEQMALLKSQMVSMANEAQVASQLEAFAQSNAEAQLSPNSEVRTTLQGASDGEIILGIPQQTSPLNLNTHESIVASMNPPHLVLEQKIHTPSQNDICNILSENSQSQLSLSSQIITSPLASDATNDMLINPNFSPGKKILINPDSINMNVDQLTSTEFSEMSATPAATATTSSMLMKVDQVMKDLNQSPQFSASVIHSPVETTQMSPMQSTVMVSPGYMNAGTDLMTVASNSFLPSQPMSIESKDVIQNELSSLPSQQFNTNMMNTCVRDQAQSMSSTETPVSLAVSSSSNDSHMVVTKSPSFGANGNLAVDNHFSSSIMSLPLESNVADVKTLRTDVESTFSNSLVFSEAEKLTVVSNEQMSLSTTSFSGVTNVSVDRDNPGFPSALEQQENGHSQVSMMNSQNHQPNIIIPNGSGSLTAGTTDSTYQTCPLVNGFSSQPPQQQTTSGYADVPASNGSVVASSADKDQSVDKRKDAVGTTSVPQVHEFTNMSDHDLLSYINPSCFDTV